MFLAIVVTSFFNWQVALNSGGLTLDQGEPGYGVVLITNDERPQLGEITLTGQFQPTVTPEQLQ